MNPETQATNENNMQPRQERSPAWNASTKALVAFTFFGLTAFLLVRFSNVLGPLLLASLLTYMLYPVVHWLTKKIKLPWALGVGLVLIMVVLILLGLFAWSGITLVEQSKGLLNFLQNTLDELPDFLEDLNQQVLVLGPFEYPFSNLNLNLDTFGQQIVTSIQPMFAQLGTIVTSIAGGAASVIAALVLVIMLTYFFLLENKGRPYRVVELKLPGYEDDIEQMGLELQRIWNGFLRGQITMVAITFVIYFILLNILGVRFALGLAVMAGFARFIPWLGPAVTWVVYFLVALLQGSTLFGLQPFPYALLVIGVAMLMDPVIDSFITPKIMGNALRVHPALLLVGVFVGAAWMGFIGLLLAGPVLATIKLFAAYALRKSFDLDPWAYLEDIRIPRQPSGVRVVSKLWPKVKDWCLKMWNKIYAGINARKRSQKKDEDNGKSA